MNMNIDIDDLENMRYLFMEQIEHFKGGGGGGGGGGGRGSSKRKNKSPYFSIFIIFICILQFVFFLQHIHNVIFWERELRCCIHKNYFFTII